MGPNRGDGVTEEYEEKLWTEDECERLCGHCWDTAGGRVAIQYNQRKCRHCGRIEEHLWVNTGIKVKP